MILKRQFGLVASLIAANFAIGLIARQIDAAHPSELPKSCEPGLDCAASLWLLLMEPSLYLALAIWLLVLTTVLVSRHARRHE